MTETVPIVLKNYIGNNWVASTSTHRINAYNPATGEVIYALPDSSSDDVEAAVQSAEQAFQKWQKTSRAERTLILCKIADLLEARLSEFAAAESKDQGKPISLAASVDIPRAIANFRFFGTALTHWTEMATGDASKRILNYTQSVPVGICGLISPWNLPLYLLTWKIAPAIAAGNCVVCKPSEITSLTASMFTEVLKAAGLPPGVVYGSGKTTGASLVSHPRVKLISFTGGTETGKAISALAAPYIKKLGLELGGKNANIIFADADLDKVVPMTVKSSFQNQGEICLCGSRIFVERDIYPQFMARFLEAVDGWRVGDPSHPDTLMGPLVSKEHLEKVMSYIDLARKEGGQIVKGGSRPAHTNPSGYFLEPTVITGLSPKSVVLQNEIFGPVVTVNVFDKGEEEAIALANDSVYGLSASIWTQDISKANRVARRLDVGTVWINCWMIRDLQVPFGGMKGSGIGREGGWHSFEFFTEKKTISTFMD